MSNFYDPRGEPTLREHLKPGDTVYTILRHVSASGMTRRISPIVIAPDSRGRPVPFDLTWHVAQVLGTKRDEKHDGIKREGCGMDMGFDLVYTLSRRLWPEGYPCIGEGCPANDHMNGDRDYTPGHVVHRDGGYALNQRWL